MSDSAPAPNNQLVVYRGRPQRERSKRMPVVSKAMNRAMHAAASGNSTLGIPASVGKEFTQDQEPGSVKNLPERARKPFKRGAISRKAANKHLGSKFGNENEIDASSR